MNINSNKKKPVELSGSMIYAIGIIFIVIVFLYAFYNNNHSPTIGDESALINELNYIQPLPKAVQTKFTSGHKAQFSFVTCYYSTVMGFDEICEYYDKELARCNWTFVKKRNVLEWGKDLGQKEVIYQKEGYYLDIQYYPPNFKNINYNYSIRLSSGLLKP